MTRVLPYMKAIVAFFGPGLFLVGKALVEGQPLTSTLLLSALGMSLVTSFAVYAVPNRDPAGEHQDESTQPPEGAPGEHRPERANVVHLDGRDLP